MDARMSIAVVRLKGTPVCGFLVGVNGEDEGLEFTTHGVAALIEQFERSQCKLPDSTGMTTRELREVSDNIRAFCDHVEFLRSEFQWQSSVPGIPNTGDNAIAVLYAKTHHMINWNELVERVEAVRPDQQRAATAPIPPPPAIRMPPQSATPRESGPATTEGDRRRSP